MLEPSAHDNCTTAVNPCDTSPCTPHQCGRTSDGNFKCICNSGYANENNGNGQYCVNINECVVSSGCQTNGSLNAGVASCQDTDGDYQCNCMSGYSSNNDKTCSDINECSTTNNCDVAERADCVNNNGGYTCTCKAGFTGDGTTCREERLVTFMNDAKFTGDYSDYICLPYAVPIGDKYLPCIYATKSGLILFSDIHSGNTNSGNRKAFTNPGADFSFLQQSGLQEKAAVAAYWANMVTGVGNASSSQGVYYKMYSAATDNATIVAVAADVQTALSNSFVAESMVVFTWYRMQYPITGEEVTLQAILLTDFINTYVVLRYQEMNWNVLTGSMSFYPATIGHARGSTLHYLYPYSFLPISNDANSDKVPFIQTVDQVDPTAAALANITDAFIYKIGSKHGQFVMSLTDNNGVTLQKSLGCKNWLDADLLDTTHPLNDTSDASTCPTAVSMFPASTFVMINDSRIPSGVACYVTIAAANANAANPQSRRCCYQGNGILTNFYSANCMNLYQRHTPVQQALDDAMCDTCCATDIGSFTSMDLCGEFVARRPVGTAVDFVNGVNAAGRGDPHFSSLDGLSFTFNGRGDYVMLNATKFSLLARLDPFVRDGVEQGATLLRSLIAQQHDPVSDIVEFRLNDTTASIGKYILILRYNHLK
ncbi:uncharacterized protein [Argopecten irradians]|uniref:uncharacterized protein n=1 Tax=Argopecten irradians TaxID=31199 RepID=UPI00371EC5E2